MGPDKEGKGNVIDARDKFANSNPSDNIPISPFGQKIHGASRPKPTTKNNGEGKVVPFSTDESSE